MSGRWGDRPLGRGGWRVLQPEASSVLPIVPLRSRAAERYTGAIRPKPFYSGSRNQLPITVAILLSTTLCVDSPTGSFFSVLPGVPARLLLVPTYLFQAIRRFSPAYKAAKMSSRRKRRSLRKIRGPRNSGGELPTNLLRLSPFRERVPISLCNENGEADASQKNYPSSCSEPIQPEKCFRKKQRPSSSAATAPGLSCNTDFRQRNS